ncbi:MAG: radical SAM family heme chaperone HemW [Prevotellaceae bacterium]|jgi:oxygen-independent coproporphyrinogen-3 oxidase|nr:radical SAM family heme chaperone HemW [Prevotellaceae bacterium]
MLYIHIPFCQQLCAYCDFYFSVSLERKEQMLAALVREMEKRQDYLPFLRLPATLYIGGGTPSVLTPDELQVLIQKARQVFSVESFSELTVEVNPDDVTRDYARQLQVIGVNRLSIGIQSFQAHHLKQLRRRHSAAQAIACVKAAQDAGFENISIDLMYGLPHQSSDEWQRDITQALSFNVPHISAYHLTIEPKTLFGKQQAKGTLSLPDEETGVQQFAYLHEALENAGYTHYEVSNFARPGFQAVHNSGYWQGVPYIGLGPSAHSYNGESRQWNVANNLRYLHAIENGLPAFETETLTLEMRYNEYILTSLRTAAGADLQHIAQTFGESFLRHCLRQAEKYLSHGRLIQHDRQLQIPPMHFIVSDEIIRELIC